MRSQHDDPFIPDDVEARHLDKAARIELKTLSKDNADEVARHLTMTARLIEEDPELAHRHAISAARRAGRIAVVRETLAITAYATGDYALALRELRTFRRISGSNEQLPLMVDSERGLQRADRALELGRSVDREQLTVPTRVELAIAMSGARLDQGQPELALAELEIPQLDPERAFSWSPSLFGAYATVLEELGRTADAEHWSALAERAARALQDEVGDETIEIIDVQIDDEELDPEPGVRMGGDDAHDAIAAAGADDASVDGLGDVASKPDGDADEDARSAAVVEAAGAGADPSPLSFEDDVRAEVEQLLAEEAAPDALDVIVAKAIDDETPAAPKRRTTKKAAAADEVDASGEAAAPKKRVAKKTAAVDEPDAPVEAAPSKKRAAKKTADEAEGAVEAAAPKKRTTKKAAAADEAEVAPPKQRTKKAAAVKESEEVADAVVESEQDGE